MTMTATRSSLTGHTLTVERIIDVPELSTSPISSDPLAQHVIVERRDGAYLRHHGTDMTRWWWQGPTCHIWDAARNLANLLSQRRGEHEDLRYVGPDRDGDWQAAYVREGWHVRLTERGPWVKVIGVLQHINLATLRRTGQIRYRHVTLVLEDGKSITRKNAAYLTARPFCA